MIIMEIYIPNHKPCFIIWKIADAHSDFICLSLTRYMWTDKQKPNISRHVSLESYHICHHESREAADFQLRHYWTWQLARCWDVSRIPVRFPRNYSMRCYTRRILSVIKNRTIFIRKENPALINFVFNATCPESLVVLIGLFKRPMNAGDWGLDLMVRHRHRTFKMIFETMQTRRGVSQLRLGRWSQWPRQSIYFIWN